MCELCIRVNQVKSKFYSENTIYINRPLELLHIDLFGSIKTVTLSEKKYGFEIVDDFSHYTWVLFLKQKYDSFEAFQKFCKRIQHEKYLHIISVRSDQWKEFESSSFKSFFNENKIYNNLSFTITSKQNRIVERKNRTF